MWLYSQKREREPTQINLQTIWHLFILLEATEFQFKLLSYKDKERICIILKIGIPIEGKCCFLFFIFFCDKELFLLNWNKNLKDSPKASYTYTLLTNLNLFWSTIETCVCFQILVIVIYLFKCAFFRQFTFAIKYIFHILL